MILLSLQRDLQVKVSHNLQVGSPGQRVFGWSSCGSADKSGQG